MTRAGRLKSETGQTGSEARLSVMALAPVASLLGSEIYRMVLVWPPRLLSPTRLAG